MNGLWRVHFSARVYRKGWALYPPPPLLSSLYPALCCGVASKGRPTSRCLPAYARRRRADWGSSPWPRLLAEGARADRPDRMNEAVQSVMRSLVPASCRHGHFAVAAWSLVLDKVASKSMLGGNTASERPLIFILSLMLT